MYYVLYLHRHIVPYNVIIIYGTSYVIAHGTYPSVRATKILNHPWYRHFLSGYDISLIMLAHPIRLQPGVAVAIPLATRTPPDSRPCLISGFGRTSANGRQSNQLLSGRASIMNSDECARIWSKNQITPSLIRRGLIFCKDIPRGQPYAARTCMILYNVISNFIGRQIGVTIPTKAQQKWPGSGPEDWLQHQYGWNVVCYHTTCGEKLKFSFCRSRAPASADKQLDEVGNKL
uniref:Peptidase S1 domain-containing protein n=1 Tax=Romanomermis culicivorax TaxID=13658 RepID=A0A915KLT5_ROMCU